MIKKNDKCTKEEAMLVMTKGVKRLKYGDAPSISMMRKGQINIVFICPFCSKEKRIIAKLLIECGSDCKCGAVLFAKAAYKKT